jgi:hypothetical protein
MYYAVIDDTNKVLNVVTSINEINEINHKQTYKKTQGKNYAGIGWTYHPEQDNFSTPQLYPSWTLDDTCKWQPPVPRPSDEHEYLWDEDAQMWKHTHV